MNKKSVLLESDFMDLNTIVSNKMLGVVKELGEGKFKIKWIGNFENFKFKTSFNN